MSPLPTPRWQLPALLLLTLALHLPFLNQAFHMDDFLYIDLARNALVHPWFPNDMPYVFDGKVVSMAGHSHPPLNAYFLALIWKFSGGLSEPLAHGFYLVFPLLATWAFFSLARRFTRRAATATLLFASVPPLVVMSHTVMADVPTLALALAGIACFISGCEEGRPVRLVLAALALSLAAFCSYIALAALPALLVFAWLKRRLRWPILLVFAAPIALLIVWQYANYLHLGQWPIRLLGSYVQQLGYLQVELRERAAASVFIFLGGTLLFPLLLVAVLLATAPWTAAVSALAGMAVLSLSHLLDGYALPERVVVTLGFGLGVAVAAAMLARVPREAGQSVVRGESDELFLHAWFLLGLFSILVLYSVGSNRYLLPLAPPLLLLSFRRLEERVPPGWIRGLSVLALAWNLVWALSLARADYEFAGAYRAYAKRLAERHLGQSQPLFFSGEWGFRHYLGAIGGRILSFESEPVPGAWVVKSRLCLSRAFAEHLDGPLVPIEQEAITVASPWHLLDRASHAGFYSTGWGLLPWSWSRAPLDEITLYTWSPFYFALDRAKLEGATPEQVFPTRLTRDDRSVLVLVQPVGSTITYTLDLPSNPRLRFVLYSAPAAGASSPLRYQVIVLRANAATTVFDQAFSPARGDRGFSRPVDVPLTSWAGQAVELRFSIEGQGGRAGWAELTIARE